MNDFTVNFGELQDSLEKEVLGTNEEGEHNIFNSTGVLVNAPYELIPHAPTRYTAITINDVVFGTAHHASDGSLTVRDGFELGGGILGGLAGTFVGGLFGGVGAFGGGVGGAAAGEALGGELYDTGGVIGRDWSHTVAVQVHGQGADQLAQRFSIIGSKWENGQRVNIIHVTENGPAGPKRWTYTTPNGQAEIDRLNAEASAIGPAAGTTGSGGSNHCFLEDTSVQMWPLDPSIKPRLDGSYDEQLVLSKVWYKRQDQMQVGDVVVSYDKLGRMQPGDVTRTMTNIATHILDFWGTGVTPGHAYNCADGPLKGGFAPIMDILRMDGALKRIDGTMFRAATNCDVGSVGDRMIHAEATMQKPDGPWTPKKRGQIRFGTRISTPDGKKSISVMEIAERQGWSLSDDGYMVGKIEGADGTVQESKFPFPYTHGAELPKPEDYILTRSQVTLEEIYLANEWEQIGTRMPAPDGLGSFNPNSTMKRTKPKPNIPPAFADRPDAPTAKNRAQRPAHTSASPSAPGMNRKQRKAMEAKQRKAAKMRRRAAG